LKEELIIRWFTILHCSIMLLLEFSYTSDFNLI
jgi:hypothetical protein